MATSSSSSSSSSSFTSSKQPQDQLEENPQEQAESLQQTLVRLRVPQARNHPKQRRPRNYWSNLENLEWELINLWHEELTSMPSSLLRKWNASNINNCNSTMGRTDSFSYFMKSEIVERPTNKSFLLIPNETLLNYWKRHDLRAAITSHGGRTVLSELLGGARIMPGRWEEAVSACPELQYIIYMQQQQSANDNYVQRQQVLSYDLPPLSPQQLKQKIQRKTRENKQQTQKRAECVEKSSTFRLTRTTEYENVTNSHIDKSMTFHGQANLLHQNQSQQQEKQHESSRTNQRSSRKSAGYWTLQQVIQELFEYLDEVKAQFNRPSVWMPRLSEVLQNGREDLGQAIQRHGGYQSIGEKAGLVAFREWSYFEGLYQLLLELKRYMDEYPPEQEYLLENDMDGNHDDYEDEEENSDTTSHKTTVSTVNSKASKKKKTKKKKVGRPRKRPGEIVENNYRIFPNASKLKKRGYHRLYLLIQYYGGRKFLSSKLGMEYRHYATSRNPSKKRKTRRKKQFDDDDDDFNGFSLDTMNWGPMDLEFAIELLEFVRMDQLRKSPPLKYNAIEMPSQAKLLAESEDLGVCLDQDILRYGGYENVARRLGLAWNIRKKQM